MSRYFNSQWQQYEKPKQEGPSLFTITFLSGILLLIFILLCRELFNWYIKHNDMVDELRRIKYESEKINGLLGAINGELKDWRKEYQGRARAENGDGDALSMRRSQRDKASIVRGGNKDQ